MCHCLTRGTLPFASEPSPRQAVRTVRKASFTARWHGLESWRLAQLARGVDSEPWHTCKTVIYQIVICCPKPIRALATSYQPRGDPALHPSSVLIVGTSARAAAHSALRSAFQPLAVDQFADTDLKDSCPAIRIADFPAGVVPAVADLPEGPWMYTGAMENHPAIIEAISQSRALWGNSAAVVRRVRDPWNVAAVLRQAGLQFPEIRVLGTEAPRPGYWLLKPFRSGGGRKIRLLSVSADPNLGSSSFGNAYRFLFAAACSGSGVRRGVSRGWAPSAAARNHSTARRMPLGGSDSLLVFRLDRTSRIEAGSNAPIHTSRAVPDQRVFVMRAVWRGHHCRQDRRVGSK